eukprot:356379-Chlamydomonas_euryale.AAC.11
MRPQAVQALFKLLGAHYVERLGQMVMGRWSREHTGAGTGPHHRRCTTSGQPVHADAGFRVPAWRKGAGTRRGLGTTKGGKGVCRHKAWPWLLQQQGDGAPFHHGLTRRLSQRKTGAFAALGSARVHS